MIHQQSRFLGALVSVPGISLEGKPTTNLATVTLCPVELPPDMHAIMFEDGDGCILSEEYFEVVWVPPKSARDPEVPGGV